MIVRSRRANSLVVAVAAMALLAACSSAGADSKGPDWKPQPAFPGDGGTVVPGQVQTPTATPTPGSSGPSSRSSSPPPAGDPSIVATKLNSPIGLAVLSDGTALVGERTTGRIVRVQPKAGQPVQVVRTLPGISTSGGGGLLDLALSPSYAQDGLIFAYLTTATDNRVVDFTLNGPVTPVLTGIPRGATHNTGRIMFGADGELYVGTGDAGTTPTATSLAGKVLRITAIGKAAAGNPTEGSPIVGAGTHEVDGLCSDTLGTDSSGAPTSTAPAIVETESRPSAATDLVQEVTGPGLTALQAPTTAKGRGLGGCAVDNGVLYVASRDGTALLAARLKTTATRVTVGAYTAYLKGKYGRLITVVTAPDGTLWLTTSNRDGHGTPQPTDDRVLHIQPPASAGISPA